MWARSSVTFVSPWCINFRISDRRSEVFRIAVSLLFAAFPAGAQTVAGDTFADRRDGAKLHVASGFVCPAKIGAFERDAVGESDPQAGVGFCAYGALDGVYGTIKLIPLHGAYDARQSLDGDFAEQEGTGGTPVAEGNINVAAGAPPLAAYARTYETAKLEDLHYRVLFTGAAIGNWAVETTIEFAEPRDVPDEQGFLHAVYAAARSEIGKTQ